MILYVGVLKPFSLLMNVIFVTFSLRCYFGDENFKRSIYENCPSNKYINKYFKNSDFLNSFKNNFWISKENLKNNNKIQKIKNKK